MPAPLYLIGNLESRRTRFFVESIKSSGLKWRIISWESVLSGKDDWSAGIEPGSTIRIDSPGQNFAVEKALLKLGNRPPLKSPLSLEYLETLSFEKGRILSSTQWYRGWTQAMANVSRCLRERKVRFINPPPDIARMFDKIWCNAALRRTGIPTSPALGMPNNFDVMIELMRESGWRRVFLKPRYSSSASDIVALEIGAGRQQGFSTVEMVREKGELKLYNSRRVRRYEKLAELRELIDALCLEDVYLERWLPKAGIEGRRFDLRVMVIGGKARQVVVRTSENPMTNLHLGARRGDLRALQETMGEEAWASAMAIAEKAMTIFPQSLYGGIDLLISPRLEKNTRCSRSTPSAISSPTSCGRGWTPTRWNLRHGLS